MEITEEMIQKIEARMQEIIDQNLEIYKRCRFLLTQQNMMWHVHQAFLDKAVEEITL